MLEGTKPAGILKLLDDEVMVPKGSDLGFISAVGKEHRTKLLEIISQVRGREPAAWPPRSRHVTCTHPPRGLHAAVS